MKVIKYWRTEPLDKNCSGMWSGYHESEEDAVQYIVNMLVEHDMFCYEEFEVLPYYVIQND
jgi:hypothetical protein